MKGTGNYNKHAESSATGKKSSLVSNIRWACVFTISFVGFLFISKPAPTPASLAFRVTLLVASLAGLAFLSFYNWSGKQVSNKSS